jgi:ADP-ribose pyrophosphatase
MNPNQGEGSVEEKIKTLGTLAADHFSVSLDTVRLPTGRITHRILVDHPEAAAVVPFLDADRILMVRQWRYALARETLEIPAGKVDSGEDATQCATRELLEETGYRAARLSPLFRYYPAIGYSNEVIRIFAAAGLVQQADHLDEDEISGVEVIGLDEIHNLIADGLIQDGKTVIGISLFRAKRERGEIPGDFLAEL